MATILNRLAQMSLCRPVKLVRLLLILINTVMGFVRKLLKNEKSLLWTLNNRKV